MMGAVGWVGALLEAGETLLVSLTDALKSRDFYVVKNSAAVLEL